MTSWRTDPALQGRFHAQFADDLQVMVHDGEPRRTKKPPEACFVRVTGVVGALRIPSAPPDAPPPVDPAVLTFTERPIYRGTLLNQPHNLTSVRQNQAIDFVTAPGLPHPLQVTAEYLRERPQWVITPCNGCGGDQTLDPMTTMAKTRFPNTPAGMAPLAFSAICPCGGTMLLAMTNLPPPAHPAPSAKPSGSKPWWKFW